MAGQQQEEIETIRSRTIEVKLSDADVKRISEKAAAHGLTVGELIENFIGDLVCGTYSNGSDERMYGINNMNILQKLNECYQKPQKKIKMCF